MGHRQRVLGLAGSGRRDSVPVRTYAQFHSLANQIKVSARLLALTVDAKEGYQGGAGKF